MQRYQCRSCQYQFQSIRRPEAGQRRILDEYVWGRQSLGQLAETHGRSHVWIRRQLDAAEREPRILVPESTVVVADTTFWGRHYGVTVFRSPSLGENLWWMEVEQELPEVYAEGYAYLCERGWDIQAAVVDGKRGLGKVFKGIPVQICQFHQMKIVTKYLTRRPESTAARELRSLTLTLARTDEATFTRELARWHERHQSFLNEHTLCPWCRRKRYTHRRLRAAFRSLSTNLPYRFTHQRYPELHIPNTTNCLDGMFSQLKNRLAVHRGMRRDRRYKLISDILSG